MLDGARDLSGLTVAGERFVAVQNRPSPGQRAQVFALAAEGEAWSVVGRWSLEQEPGAWVDAEAITTTERGTVLVLVESLGGDGQARIWELGLPEAAREEDTPRAELHRQWRLPASYRERLGAGAEAMTRVPTPAGSDDDDSTWVLVGHQALDRVGLFRLVPDEADPSTPIAPVRELATDATDTSGMEWDGGWLYLWHNENLATPRCLGARPHVNVLERYAWTAKSTPEALRGSTERWAFPRTEGPCRNLEAIALGPCRDGTRTLLMLDDDGTPSAGARVELEGFCP